MYIKACDYKGCQNTDYSGHCDIRDVLEEASSYLFENRKDLFDSKPKHICDVCIELINDEHGDDDYPLLMCDHMGRVIKNPTFITKIPTIK